MRKIHDSVFGRIAILDASTGEAITRIDADQYPIDSDLSTRYEHPGGIVLSLDTARRAGITIVITT